MPLHIAKAIKKRLSTAKNAKVVGGGKKRKVILAGTARVSRGGK